MNGLYQENIYDMKKRKKRNRRENVITSPESFKFSAEKKQKTLQNAIDDNKGEEGINILFDAGHSGVVHMNNTIVKYMFRATAHSQSNWSKIPFPVMADPAVSQDLILLTYMFVLNGQEHEHGLSMPTEEFKKMCNEADDGSPTRVVLEMLSQYIAHQLLIEYNREVMSQKYGRV